MQCVEGITIDFFEKLTYSWSVLCCCDRICLSSSISDDSKLLEVDDENRISLERWTEEFAFILTHKTNPNLPNDTSLMQNASIRSQSMLSSVLHCCLVERQKKREYYELEVIVVSDVTAATTGPGKAAAALLCVTWQKSKQLYCFLILSSKYHCLFINWSH